MALIINQDIPTQTIAITAVFIPSFHLVAFLLSEPEESTKNQLYNMNIKATNANIANVQLMVICTNAKAYHNFVSYVSGWGNLRIHTLLSPMYEDQDHIGSAAEISSQSIFQGELFDFTWYHPPLSLGTNIQAC